MGQLPPEGIDGNRRVSSDFFLAVGWMPEAMLIDDFFFWIQMCTPDGIRRCVDVGCLADGFDLGGQQGVLRVAGCQLLAGRSEFRLQSLAFEAQGVASRQHRAVPAIEEDERELALDPLGKATPPPCAGRTLPARRLRETR